MGWATAHAQTLHRFMKTATDLRHAPRYRRLPHERIFPDDLPERLSKSHVTVIHPLLMCAHDETTASRVSRLQRGLVFAQTYQAGGCAS